MMSVSNDQILYLLTPSLQIFLGFYTFMGAISLVLQFFIKIDFFL